VLFGVVGWQTVSPDSFRWKFAVGGLTAQILAQQRSQEKQSQNLRCKIIQLLLPIIAPLWYISGICRRFSSIGRVVSSLVCSVARAAIDSNPA
jgi:hypothetical protein